ncbi:MAG: hypothetical protein MI920_24900, partial [Kiloniellales bacterium]|nr:hypothetical protein [Kiloniellales bacterium]
RPNLLMLSLSKREGLGMNMARETKGRDRRLSIHPPKPAAPPPARTTADLWLRRRCAVFICGEEKEMLS